MAGEIIYSVLGIPGWRSRWVRLFVVLRSLSRLGRPAEADDAGEKLFVDFAGRTAEIIDGLSGEMIPVQIFVAVLGASSFTYAEAVWSQKLPDWITAHVRAFTYFGSAARQTVSNNLKAGIIKACFHEPMINRTYADMARHYRTAIVPARPARRRASPPEMVLRDACSCQ